jgi:formamidopyrimidine-DNA glycosylase
VPELPEVETVVRDLRPHLVGRRLTSLRAGRRRLRRPWLRRWGKQLRGRRVETIDRRGKWVVLRLQGDLYLVFHLGMTGQLTVVPTRHPRANHTHLIFDLDSGQQLRFRDIRRFGSATLYPDEAALRQFFEASGLGPEPFDLEAGYWKKCLQRTRRALKVVLLDQRIVAGVGNIYADEALFEARLHPRRRGCDLTAAEADRLRKAVMAVLARAIQRRGSTIRNYVGGSGLRGQYQEEFRVYGRTGQPCRRCRAPIERLSLGGRSSHFCPACQKGQVGCVVLR